MRQAIEFLTVFPVPGGHPAKVGSGAWAFAIVGVLLGLLATGCAWVWHDGALGAVAAVAALALFTGGLHEDGLADVFDALRVGRSRERMFAVLSDSRIGAHGTLALVAVFCWRWQALAAMHGEMMSRLPAVCGVSRVAIVVLAATTPAAGSGLGRAFGDSLPKHAAVWASLQAIALSAVLGWPAAVAVLGGNAVLLIVLRRWFLARLGGVTGDCLGAACQLSECVSLGALAWL